MPTVQGVDLYCTLVQWKVIALDFCFGNKVEAEGVGLLCNGCLIFSLKIAQSLSGCSSVEQSHLLQEEEDVVLQNICLLKTFVEFGFKCYSVNIYCLLDSSESNM